MNNERWRYDADFNLFGALGGLRKTRHKGVERTQLDAYMVGSAYNLLRIANLMAVSA